MKVIDIIQKSGNTVFSFELLPPLKGQKADKLYRTIDELIEYKPQYINITTHRDEVEFRELPNGLMQKRIVRKRPGTVAIAAAIQNAYNIPVVPHIVCGGFSREETENVLIDLNFLGINNILALRGDGLKFETTFTPDERGGHSHAKELVDQVVNLKQGKYLDPDIKNNAPLDFCIGVAGYPEKHFESPNLDIDLVHLKEKVDAGADYVVTQNVFRQPEILQLCRTLPFIWDYGAYHSGNQTFGNDEPNYSTSQTLQHRYPGRICEGSP